MVLFSHAQWLNVKCGYAGRSVKIMMYIRLNRFLSFFFSPLRIFMKFSGMVYIDLTSRKKIK